MEKQGSGADVDQMFKLSVMPGGNCQPLSQLDPVLEHRASHRTSGAWTGCGGRADELAN